MVMEGLMGGRIFSPVNVNDDDEVYRTTILATQCACFGPLPKQFVDYYFDDDTTEFIDAFERLVSLRGGRKLYRNTLAVKMSTEAVDFLDRLMKLDPRDRPSAQDLLQDQWFSGVTD